jgi:transcription initiation factor TFIIF subunit beta
VPSQILTSSQKTDSTTTKAKAQEQKTARIAQNELLDLIFDCFKDYRYWSMTALRQKLHQPEAYLRQTLLMIGEQVKSGPFNNHWKLKNESQIENVDLNAIKDSSAPQQDLGDGGGMTSAAGSDDDDDDDDDDDVMEDVGI